MFDVEAKVVSPEEAVKRAHEEASKYGARIITPDKEIEELTRKYGWKKARNMISVEYQGRITKLSGVSKIGKKRQVKLTPEQRKARAERLAVGRKRKVYIKPGRKSGWYEYELESKLEKGKISRLSQKDIEALAPLFWEIINELYPFASSSATITRLLSSGAGLKFSIANYPRLYSSKRAFSDVLKALTLSGAFDDKPDGWKAVAVIFRLKADSVEELVEKLNRRMEKLASRYGVAKPAISPLDKPSTMLAKVSNFYKEYRSALITRGMPLPKEGESLKEKEHTAYKRALGYRRARMRLSEIMPPGELRGKKVKIAEEIGEEFLEVSQPITFTQNLVNGLVIGFVSIGTLWATSRISDFIANWISRWLKMDERYIKALGDIGAGILILNSPNIWRAFMRDEMPIQGKISALVVGWSSIANGITLALRNERLIKVSEMVDSAIEGIGKFITQSITQGTEEEDKSKLQQVAQEDDWKVSTQEEVAQEDDWKVSTQEDIEIHTGEQEDIETHTEEIDGIDLLPNVETTESEYIDLNLEIDERR